MPNRVEPDSGGDTPATEFWTDDLPVCSLSGIGLATNQIYREDGQRVEEHKFEDKSFRFCIDGSTYLYCVLDGENGDRVSSFVHQRLPAELLLDQLSRCQSDQDVCSVLHQAFLCVEQAYIQSIGDLLAEKADLQMQIPQPLSEFQLYQQFPHTVDRLKMINREISSGSTAVLALIMEDKLFISNIGNCRALLCKTAASSNGAGDDTNLRIIQLTVDHDLVNADELLRLSHLGLRTDDLIKHRKLGNQEVTRKLGDYSVKGGYKEFDDLKAAFSEPVIAEPDIHGGLTLDQSCRFLILASHGVIRSLSEVLGGSPEASCGGGAGGCSVNSKLAALVAQEFYQQHTLVGVAQAVVDRVVRMHHDAFMMRSREQAAWCRQREDMTLLVRNLNFPLGGNPVPYGGTGATSRTLTPGSVGGVSRGEPGATLRGQSTPAAGGLLTNPPGTETMGTYSSSTATSTSGAASSEPSGETLPSFRSNVPLQLNEEGRVAAYVDFSDYYRSLAEVRAGGAGDLAENGEGKDLVEPDSPLAR